MLNCFKFIFIFLIFSISVSLAVSQGKNKTAPRKKMAPREAKLYYGKDSTEAQVTFQHEVEFHSGSKPSQNLIQEKIEDQVLHLFGSLSAHKYPAVPLGSHKISQIETREKAGESKTYIVSYSYDGKWVIHQAASKQYSFVLPNNPDKIYAAGVIRRNGEPYNPCTDAHYQSEGDFWYFWNPEQSGCQLKKGVHYQEIQGTVERIKNTAVTYPEYEELLDSDGTLSVSILLGMDETSNNRNPYESSDVNAGNFVRISKQLKEMQFTSRTLTPKEIFEIVPKEKVKKLPYVEEWTKVNPKAKMKVLLFFGPSGIDEDSTAFHYFYSRALAKDSIMIYDGHSGLGGHLDLPALERETGIPFQPNRQRYQIYFFNSCTSYTYYNTMYFGRKSSPTDKRGTKKLDIITNGLATYFSVMDTSSLTLVKAVDAWARNRATLSYQTIVDEIDSRNLAGINGDEDNPTLPPR